MNPRPLPCRGSDLPLIYQPMLPFITDYIGVSNLKLSPHIGSIPSFQLSSLTSDETLQHQFDKRLGLVCIKYPLMTGAETMACSLFCKCFFRHGLQDLHGFQVASVWGCMQSARHHWFLYYSKYISQGHGEQYPTAPVYLIISAAETAVASASGMVWLSETAAGCVSAKE